MNTFIIRPLIFILVTFFLIWGLVNCGGGDGTPRLTHEELAQRFVDALELGLGYDVDLVKANTLQYNYIVVYDYDTDTFDAYWIGNYNVGDSIRDYLNRYDNKFRIDLDPLGNNLYEDFWTGFIFEDTHSVSRSSSAHQQYLSNVFHRAKAETIVDKYGLSYERATKLVDLAMNYKALSRKGALTETEYDRFAMEALGTPATTLMKIDAEADIVGGKAALERAAKKNGIGVVHAAALFYEEFGVNLQ